MSKTCKDGGWKNKYIRRWIPTGGPFSGASIAIKALLYGENLGAPNCIVPPLVVREEIRTYESSMIIVPMPHIWQDVTIVQTPTKNYSTFDYKTLFKLAKIETGYERFVLANNLTGNLTPPNVDTTNIYSTGVKTPLRLAYSGSFERSPSPHRRGNFDKKPKIIYGEGDGMVNLRSLSDDIGHWKQNNGGHEYKEHVLKNVHHLDIIKSARYVLKVIDLLTQPDN